MFRLPLPVFAADPPPAGGTPPPAGGTPPAGTPPAGGTPPPAAAPKMPDGLPSQFWDSQGGKVNVTELVKSYGELATFKTAQDERVKALPAKPEDYKLDFKLPDTVKLPEGFQVKIDEKDPRLAVVRSLAHKYQLPQEAVSSLLAMDAEHQVTAHVAAEAAIQAEMKKLGENGKARVDAANTFLSANVSQEEHAAMREFISNSVAFAGLEKLIAKALTQNVPGHQPGGQPQPKPADIPIEQRWYGNGAAPQQKAV